MSSISGLDMGARLMDRYDGQGEELRLVGSCAAVSRYNFGGITSVAIESARHSR